MGLCFSRPPVVADFSPSLNIQLAHESRTQTVQPTLPEQVQQGHELLNLVAQLSSSFAISAKCHLLTGSSDSALNQLSRATTVDELPSATRLLVQHQLQWTAENLKEPDSRATLQRMFERLLNKFENLIDSVQAAPTAEFLRQQKLLGQLFLSLLQQDHPFSEGSRLNCLSSETCLKLLVLFAQVELAKPADSAVSPQARDMAWNCLKVLMLRGFGEDSSADLLKNQGFKWIPLLNTLNARAPALGGRFIPQAAYSIEKIFNRVPALYADRAFVLAAVKKNGILLFGLIESFRKDPEIAKAAVAQHWLAIFEVLGQDELNNDPEIWEVAVAQEPGLAFIMNSPLNRT